MLHVSKQVVLAFAFGLALSSCRSTSMDRTDSQTRLEPLTREDWNRLATEKIFFGHQSVGANILQGVREIAAKDPHASLNLVPNPNPESVRGPALIEARLGRNGDPASKSAEFYAVLSRGMGEEGGIALFKYCFTDIDASTDIEALFQSYRDQAAKIKTAYPHLVLVHVTVPLTVAENPLKSVVKRWLRRPSENDANAKRNRFNVLLRYQYAGVEPLFDLAAVESTHTDGTRSYVGSTASPVYVLAPEFTDDGSHLNAAGRRVVATSFLTSLANVAAEQQELR